MLHWAHAVFGANGALRSGVMPKSIMAAIVLENRLFFISQWELQTNIRKTWNAIAADPPVTLRHNIVDHREFQRTEKLTIWGLQSFFIFTDPRNEDRSKRNVFSSVCFLPKV